MAFPNSATSSTDSRSPLFPELAKIAMDSSKPWIHPSAVAVGDTQKLSTSLQKDLISSSIILCLIFSTFSGSADTDKSLITVLGSLEAMALLRDRMEAKEEILSKKMKKCSSPSSLHFNITCPNCLIEGVEEETDAFFPLTRESFGPQFRHIWLVLPAFSHSHSDWTPCQVQEMTCHWKIEVALLGIGFLSSAFTYSSMPLGSISLARRLGFWEKVGFSSGLLNVVDILEVSPFPTCPLASNRFNDSLRLRISWARNSFSAFTASISCFAWAWDRLISSSFSSSSCLASRALVLMAFSLRSSSALRKTVSPWEGEA